MAATKRISLYRHAKPGTSNRALGAMKHKICFSGRFSLYGESTRQRPAVSDVSGCVVLWANPEVCADAYPDCI